ncbi:MAG: MBL fold metallo-hydrolase [archaeon]|nr:MBL fold metallo-hydrolase [archaeon]
MTDFSINMLTKICDDVWKFTGSDKSNVYFLDFNKKILIDVGNRTDRDLLKIFLGKVIDFEKIEAIIFTHLHYDHCGNFDLFPNAEFFASEKEIEDFHKNKNNTVLDSGVAEMLNIKIRPLQELDCDLKLLETPGHTRGSVCLLDEKRKLLFSGDTFFGKSIWGRVDLPTSVSEEMKDTMIKVTNVEYKILCPGHDY